jgi:hypothetical protein
MHAVIKEKGVNRSVCRALSVLLLLGFSFALQPAFGQAIPDSGITEAEQVSFTRGQSLYNHGLYGEAIATLNEFLTKYPSSSIKDLGLLWLGRSYLAQGDIANAEKVGLRLKDIPDTPLASLYEDELRVGRQSFAKAASPKHSSKVEVVHKEIPSIAVEPLKPKDSESAAVVPKPVAPEPSRSKASESAAVVVPKPVAAEAVKTKDSSTAALIPKPVESSKASSTPTTNPPILVTEKEKPASSQSKALESQPRLSPVLRPQREATKKAVEARTGAPVVAPRAQKRETVVSPTPLLRSQFEAGFSTGSYWLVMLNDGSARASDLTVRVELSPLFIYISSDLLPIRQEMIGQRQVLTFRIPAIEAGETKMIQILVHPPSNARVTTPPLRQSIFYKDPQGRFQHTP